MTKSKNRESGPEALFWNGRATVIREEPEANRVYELEERTARFVEAVIDLAKAIPQNPVTNRIINQLVGATTSVVANYVEADDAVSKKEFLKSIGTRKKEAREVKHFLRMTVRAVPELKHQARKLWMEARELHLIFSKIWRSGKMNDETQTMITGRMEFVIRASSLIRHSSFVIPHSDHAR